MTDSWWIRRTSTAAMAVLLAAIWIIGSAPASHAAGNTYFFHGTTMDQTNKSTPPGTATFNTTAPSTAVLVTQTSSPLGNPDLPGATSRLRHHHQDLLRPGDRRIAQLPRRRA